MENTITRRVSKKNPRSFSRLESHGRRMWQERWINASKASSFYRSHTSNVNERSKIWASTRKEQVLLTRVRCDQLRLNQNLFKQGKHPTGQCDKTKRCATRPSPLPTIFRRERSNESSGLASHPISQRTTMYERSGKQRSDHLS